MTNALYFDKVQRMIRQKNKVWKVDNSGYCTNLCGGNFAITRSVLEKVNFFDENMK